MLACYTLHNDLANFDRRAHTVDHYLMPELEAAAARSGQSLKDVYAHSYLGGSDVVRLRIINEMRRYGCPLPPDAFLLEADRRTDGRKRVITLPLK